MRTGARLTCHGASFSSSRSESSSLNSSGVCGGIGGSETTAAGFKFFLRFELKLAAVRILSHCLSFSFDTMLTRADVVVM